MTTAKIIMTITLMVMSSQAAMKKYNCTKTTTEPPSPVQTTGKGFDCIEDWGIVCVKDSQCCSKVCLKPFCKILGIPDFSTTRKQDRRPTTDHPSTKYPTTNHPTTDHHTPCSPCCNCCNCKNNFKNCDRKN